MKFQYYKGIKFTRDDSTGYYLNSTLRERMHRYVWKDVYQQDIPEGYHVHHIDHDKGNNDISNLELVQASEHSSYHGSLRNKEWLRNNLTINARPKASEWHGSQEGREWHREHYEKTKHLLNVRQIIKCESCNEEFDGIFHSRFCSNKCKSKYRRDNGLDNVMRACEYCKKEFATNKYKKTKTCSRSCTNKLRSAAI